MGIFSFISEFAGFSNNAFAIDLGTVNTLIAVHGAGVVLNESTAVAVSSEDSRSVLAVGNEAVEMSGRMPTGMVLRYPFRDGVIADYRLAEYMIHSFFNKALKAMPSRGLSVPPRVLLCVPSCVTDVERRAVCTAVKSAGARDVLVADEIMAACIGSDLPYDEPTGSMVIDIGGGTSDAAVIALSGIVVSKSIKVGGNHIDRAIINSIRRRHNVVIGNRTAEQLKMHLCMKEKKNFTMDISGLSLETGLPCKISVTNTELSDSISSSVQEIVMMARDILSSTPPELASDIMQNGIMLCGGGALLSGLAEAVQASTGINVRISSKPLECVALGALEMLNNIRHGKASSLPSMVEQEAL